MFVVLTIPARSNFAPARKKVKALLHGEGIWVILSPRMAKIAIIETGGKQHLVTEGSVHNIEKLKGEHKPGDKLTFDKVLLVDDGSSTKVGAPYIDGAKVSAELVADGRGKKITVIHYRQKSRYFKKNGHRQPHFKVKIESLK